MLTVGDRIPAFNLQAVVSTEQALQLLDAGRQGGLRDEARLRRLAEVKAVRQLDEIAELPQGRQRARGHGGRGARG